MQGHKQEGNEERNKERKKTNSRSIVRNGVGNALRSRPGKIREKDIKNAAETVVGWMSSKAISEKEKNLNTNGKTDHSCH